jgi:uncharacterized OB-fold protein
VVEKPVPEPDEASASYWEGAASGQLLVTRCVPNHHLFHPPDVACPVCGSDELESIAVSGRGSVYSFAVVRQAFDPAYLDDVPYVVALVALDEDPSVRILTNIVETRIDDVVIGMPVEATFERRGSGAIPQFRARSLDARTA